MLIFRIENQLCEVGSVSGSSPVCPLFSLGTRGETGSPSSTILGVAEHLRALDFPRARMPNQESGNDLVFHSCEWIQSEPQLTLLGLVCPEILSLVVGRLPDRSTGTCGFSANRSVENLALLSSLLLARSFTEKPRASTSLFRNYPGTCQRLLSSSRRLMESRTSHWLYFANDSTPSKEKSCAEVPSFLPLLSLSDL